MPKLTLTNLTSGYGAKNTVNANNDLIEAAIENTLSRDGTGPNMMNAPLDMNSNRVVNLGSPQASNDAARWIDVTSALAISTAVPSQSGNENRALFTDGTSLNWRDTPYYPRTSEEISLSITPSNYTYPVGDIRRYGAVLDGVTNDYNAINNAILIMNAIGGGYVRGWNGKTSRVQSPIIIRDGVIVDVENGKILCVLSASTDYGVRLRNNSGLINFEIEVQSSGTPGSQAGYHSPIVIGPFSGDGGTVSSPSVDEGVSGWVIRNGKAYTNKASGGVGIQIMGGANNGIIENFEVPNNSTMFGAVHLDWGYLGSISSSDIPTSRTNFDSGNAYTTHPNNIIIKNIKVGVLSRPFTTPGTGSDGIRLSGCYNITIENVRVNSTTESGFINTSGDLGAEFMPISQKPYFNKNITITNYQVLAANNGYGFYIDSYADNVDAEPAYTELADTVNETTITLNSCFTKGSGTSSALYGYRIYNVRNCTLNNCEAVDHLTGVLIDAGAHKVSIVGGRFWRNRQYGITFINSGTKPTDTKIFNVFCDQNGQDTSVSYAGIMLNWCTRPVVHNCKFGADGYVTESTQDYGLRIFDSSVTDADIQGCYVNAVASGGTAYQLASSEAYGVLKIFANNGCNSSITNKISGVNIIPVGRSLNPSGTLTGKFLAATTVLSSGITPVSGTWVRGDTIDYIDVSASSYKGTVCVSSGSPGTWKQYGATTA